METDPVVAAAAQAVVAPLDYPGVTITIDASTEESRQLMAELKLARRGRRAPQFVTRRRS